MMSNVEKIVRNEGVRKLWATGEHSSAELAFFFKVKAQRISYLCKDIERNMQRKCKVCEKTFTARNTRQILCHSQKCRREHHRRYRARWIRRKYVRENMKVKSNFVELN